VASPDSAAPVVPLGRPAASPPWVATLEGATLFLLLALAGTILAGTPGYRFGDSNHGITVPILKRLMDPTLYPGDVMVATAERFPTVFYRALALVLPGPGSIPAAFFVLYVLSVAATLAGAYRLGRWAGGPAAGVLSLLLAFPVRIGLAGEALYRVAFSHSHVASALTIWAIVWFLEGRRLLPLLVLSLGAYNHVLYSVYVLVPMLLYVLWEAPRAGRRQTLVHLAAGIVPLLPLLAWSASRGAPMTPQWLELLRLRSAHHSFPSYFGGDLPEAAAIAALAALAVSRMDADRRRLVAVFLAGTALQFVLGTVFTELIPVKAVLQYQPHRVWRFTVLLLRAVAAAGVVAGYREGGAARGAAVLTGVLLAVPGLEALLPLAVLLQATLGRPRPEPWARVLAAAVLVMVTGWGDREIQYGFPGELLPRALHHVVMGSAALGIVLLTAREASARARRLLAVAVAAATVLWLTPTAYAFHKARWESGSWRAAQDWVRENTPRSAVFLTPPKEAGFRVFSERTVVGEWKDGTQQYFDDGFVGEWGSRMETLGDDYAQLADDQILALAARYGASYIVLPRRPPRPGLVQVYRNPTFAIYEARRSAP
jgi:hypothetical protein